MKANSSLCVLQNHFLPSKPKPHAINFYFLPPVPSFSAMGADLRLLPVHKLLIQSRFPKELGPQQAFIEKNELPETVTRSHPPYLSFT